MFMKKGKFLMIGTIGDGTLFNGYGVHLDLSESSVYYGSFKDSTKHGYGHLQKFKSS
jgi:hypothetical protein